MRRAVTVSEGMPAQAVVGVEVNGFWVEVVLSPTSQVNGLDPTIATRSLRSRNIILRWTF